MTPNTSKAVSMDHPLVMLDDVGAKAEKMEEEKLFVGRWRLLCLYGGGTIPVVIQI